MGTEKANCVILGIDPKHGMGLTDSDRAQSLRLPNEAVNFVHLIDARLGPAFSLNDFFDFFSERFHVFREGGQEIDCVCDSLFKNLKCGLSIVMKATYHRGCVDRCEVDHQGT